MIEHISPINWMKRKEHFTVKHIPKLLAHINALPTLNKVKAVLSKHESKSADADCGVDDGLTEDELTALRGLNKLLDLLEAKLEADFESNREDYLKDKKRGEDMRALLIELLTENLPLRLTSVLGRVCFESRKRIVQVLSILLHEGDSELHDIMTVYLEHNGETLIQMLTALFACDGTALHCGSLLRKGFSHPCLVKECLNMGFLSKFCRKYMQSETFDTVSDAFLTVNALLSSDKIQVAKFLTRNCDAFQELFNKHVLSSPQYLTQRNGLELLHDILFERQNFAFMIEYVNRKQNLILIMDKMVDPSHAIRIKAVHIFKIFVANPNKQLDVVRILSRNQDKLLEFIQTEVSVSEGSVTEEEKINIIDSLKACGKDGLCGSVVEERCVVNSNKKDIKIN